MEDKDDSHSKDMPLMDNQKKREVTVTEEEGTGAGWSDKAQKVILNYKLIHSKLHYNIIQQIFSKLSMLYHRKKGKDYPIISYFWEFIVVITWNWQGLGQKKYSKVPSRYPE